MINTSMRSNNRFLFAAALLITISLSACSEYLPVSSGALTGTLTTTPPQWTDVGATEIIQLETRAKDPYSVNLWVVELTGDLFIFAGDSRTTWVENIDQSSDVRLQANSLIYELSATRVTNPDKFELFAQAWERKYGNRPQNENVDETYLFRLQPR